MGNSCRLLTLLVCVCLGITGCKKNGGGADAPKGERMITAKGIAHGTEVKKMIGTAGGELVSADGKLKITVAPGTVTSNTEFSIQPITSTLYGNRGFQAYRLLPETNSFPQPVKLEFSYAGLDLQPSEEDLLIMASQTATGGWRAETTSLNKTTKTVTVETTHFSDWTPSVVLELRVLSPIVRAGDETNVWIMCYDENDFLTALGMPEWKDYVKLSSIRDWRIITGTGELVADNEHPGRLPYAKIYKAPQLVNGTMEVEISVTVDGSIKIPDPKAPNGYRNFQQMQLLAGLTVVGNGMTVDFDGTKYTLAGNAVQAMSGGGTTTITGQNDEITVSISISAAAEGEFPCGLTTTSGRAGVQFGLKGTNPMPMYSSYFIKCSDYSFGYTSAPVFITKYLPVGMNMEGHFSGGLFLNSAPPLPKYTGTTDLHYMEHPQDAITQFVQCADGVNKKEAEGPLFYELYFNLLGETPNFFLNALLKCCGDE